MAACLNHECSETFYLIRMPFILVTWRTRNRLPWCCIYPTSYTAGLIRIIRWGLWLSAELQRLFVASCSRNLLRENHRILLFSHRNHQTRLTTTVFLLLARLIRLIYPICFHPCLTPVLHFCFYTCLTPVLHFCFYTCLTPVLHSVFIPILHKSTTSPCF